MSHSIIAEAGRRATLASVALALLAPAAGAGEDPLRSGRPEQSAPQQPLDLDARVRAEIAGFRGKVSLFARNLDTGRSYGLGADELLRKVFGGGNARARVPALEPFGLGVTTPREMVTLLEKIESGEVVSRDASREMIEILKRQQVHEGIGRTLSGVPVANKTGALDRLRSDVGIVYSDRGRSAMAVSCTTCPRSATSRTTPASC